MLALARAEDLLIERLHPSAVADLDAWRRALTDEDRNVEVRLRHIIQLVTTRSSITEAFS